MKSFVKVVLCLVLVTLVCSVPAWSTSIRDGDIGTIGWLLRQSDSTRLTIPGVHVSRVGASGRSFAIKEAFEKETTPERLIVISTSQLPVSEGWSVNVTGTLRTVASRAGGTQRVLVASPTDIFVACSSNNRPVFYLPWKMAGLDWENMRPLPELAASMQGSVFATRDAELPPMPDLGESESGTPPVYCETIADAKAQYDPESRVLVELQCRSIRNPTSGLFELLEDSSSDTIPVYYTGTVQSTDRVNKIAGTIQKDSGNDYWLEVDSGPNWSTGDRAGCVQALASGTIAWAKTFPDYTDLPTDGRTYPLENKRVVWVGNEWEFYVAEPDGSSGILVTADISCDAPATASLSWGNMGTTDQGERTIYAIAVATPGGPPPRPHGMSQRSLGGADLNVFTPGAQSGCGINTFGKLVRTCGRVTSVSTDDSYFYIDDGSHLVDGTTNSMTSEPNVGVRILFSDAAYPDVGDFALVEGPCARSIDWSASEYIVCIKTHGLADVVTYPPRVTPDGLKATGCNGSVVMSWNPLNVEGYRVYRSATETGTYSLVGESTSPDYVDAAVANGNTYWYKVAAASGGQEGPLSEPASAMPTALAPVVSIDSITIGSDGLATIQCSGSSTAIYNLVVDGEPIWVFEPNEIGNIAYDTTQLSNGSHKVELRALSGNYSGVASQTIAVQNDISEFNVPDDVGGRQPISAVFSSSTNWTLTCAQGGTPLYTTTGTGTSMNVTWDAGATWGDFDVTLSACGKSKTVKSRKDQGSNPRPPYVWSAVYPADTNPSANTAFAYEQTQAVNALFWKLGYTVVPYGQLTLDNQWNNVVIDEILTAIDMPADIFVFSGHGVVGPNDSTLLSWQGGMAAKFPNSSYTRGSGLMAFKAVTPFLNGTGWYGALGPAIHNYLDWDLSTGRWKNWQVERRLKFVMIVACETGRGLLPLAFGIPRNRHPGLGRAFLSFTNEVDIDVACQFSYAFWNEWKKSGVNLAQAAYRAYCASRRGNRTADYIIHGDPNLTIW